MKRLPLLFSILIVAFAGVVSSAGYPCYAEPQPSPGEMRVFGQDTCSSVYNNPPNPTSFTISEARTITKIGTYHWNDAKGVTPGTIGLRDQDGNVWGPWQAVGLYGQGGVPNAYWVAYLRPFELPAGSYTVIDSDPYTWSYNSESGNSGIVSVIAQGSPYKTTSTAALSKGWDIFGEPLAYGEVAWAILDNGTLQVSFELSGASPNHLYIVGAHFFDPDGSLNLPGVCQFAGWNLGCIREPLTREGSTATLLGAWDFGYLKTDDAGYGKVEFNLAPPQGVYYAQFTVRVGEVCEPPGGITSGCGVVYRTGNKLGEGFEAISIG